MQRYGLDVSRRYRTQGSIREFLESAHGIRKARQIRTSMLIQFDMSKYPVWEGDVGADDAVNSNLMHLPRRTIRTFDLAKAASSESTNREA
jgi:hypothetical protein